MAVEGILINGVTEILNNLLSVVAQEISLSWVVKHELKKFQQTLKRILAVLTDAERRRATQEPVRLWLRRLKDVAYDAEDVMHEFSYDTLRRREDHLKPKVLGLVSSFSPLASHFKLARRIKEVNQKFVEITKYMDRFQFQIIPTGTAVTRGESSEQRSRQTTYFASQEQIVGRAEDKNKLIKILTTVTTASSSASPNSSDLPLDKIPVVSIVGMGGLGKTTLAQLVYDDDSIKRHFETKIWVCVSDPFDVYKVLSDIMEFITENKFSALSNSEELAHKVRDQLSGKRYLLVLDDLWSDDAEQWKKLLQSSLNFGAQGSKILVTTRKKQVADVVKGSVPPYFLEILQADQCWSIMERKAFSPGGARKTPVMINIGKEIANKCGGLPLAAKFLGSIMHSKNNESNWLSIRDNDTGNTPESRIIAILKLSYDNLSPHLQRCFSYCSIFPKDLELSKQTLIQLWMAEGFLQPSLMGNDCSSEDIGDEYFESLLWSSFFDGKKKNELDDVMTFKMHDLVRDLAQAIAGDHECSTVKVTDLLGANSGVRRLNLIMDEAFLASESINNMKKLRTLIILEPNYTLSLLGLSSNKHLRVLHMRRPTKSGRSGIIYSTSKFRQLRYFHVTFLNQSGDDYSFSRLYNLQTLVLSGCSLVQNRVNEMGSLKYLRHLDISFTDIQELPDSVTSLHNLQRLDLSHCENLTTFPESVTGLECLRFLDMSSTPIEKLPDFVTSLCNLRTLDVNTCKRLKTLPESVASLKNLSVFNFKNCPLLKTLPKDFGALYQLRSLDLVGTEISVLPESCTNLSNLEYVHLFSCEFPKEVTNWIKLRKFYHYNVGRPMGIAKLIWLQELIYDVREKVIGEPECNDGIEELANMNSLEVLFIGHLENVKDPIDAERGNLKGKENLHTLGLKWVEALQPPPGAKELFALLGLDLPQVFIQGESDQKSCNHLQVFEALQPPSGLTSLFVHSFMGSDLPTWMYASCVPNLESLVLQNCNGIKQLPAEIGQLPRLRHLMLEGISLKRLDVDGFPSLIELILFDMCHLDELGGSYACLQDLKIKGCKSLTEIRSFPSLTQLRLEKIDPELVCSIGRSQTSLTKLYLENIEDLMYFPISILQNNSNLLVLSFNECNKFQGFRANDDENGDNIDLLVPVSLQNLLLRECRVLNILPDLRRWTSLRNLAIFNCPQLKESLTYDLKSLSFLESLYVDFIQRDEQLGDPSVNFLNLLE